MSRQKNSIKQQQVLKQKLSFQNIQLFKMMELNLLQFDQKIKEELEANPALENLDEFNERINESLDERFNISEQSSDSIENSRLKNEDANFHESRIDSLSDNSIYRNTATSDYNKDDDDHDLYIPVEDNESLSSSLLNQLKYNISSERQYTIGEFIIGNLDDDGYLRRTVSNIVDDLSFRQNFITNEKEVQEVLELIQDLDPPGIAAMTLQECLLLQLQRKKYSVYVQKAIDIIQNQFESYSKKHYDRIIKKLKISEEDFDKVHHEILALNPRPSESILKEDSLGKFIIPDFNVYKNGNKLELELHSYNQPNLVISPEFAEMLTNLKEERKKSKENQNAHEYLTEKINKANLFISLVKERQETMILIMSSLLKIQKQYFLTGDESELKPMVLRNIAEDTGFDISTVSRVTNSKYVQTEYGVLPLKFFFSEGMLNEEGEEISTRKIMKKLEEIVKEENSEDPLSDDQITSKLKEHGFIIARRTTAKYRENLNIPPKHLRKQHRKT